MTPDINSLIGIPYVKGGRSLDGIDCWGLVMEVYRRMGRSVPDFDSSFMSRPDTIRRIRDGEALIANEIEEPEQWCIVSDSVKGHVGLWLNGSLLHAAERVGVVLQPWNAFRQVYFRSRFYRCLA